MVTEESGVGVRTLRMHDKKAIPFIKSAFHLIKKLSHPHLCALLKLVQGKHNRLYIIAEHYSQTIRDKLSTQTNFDETTIWKHIFSITTAISYIQNNNTCNIVHRNLNSGNIVITPSENEIKLSMEYCISHLNKEHSSFNSKNILYMAPETLANFINRSSTASQSSKVDVWSIGMLILEMIVGKNLIDTQNADKNTKFVTEYLTLLGYNPSNAPSSPGASPSLVRSLRSSDSRNNVVVDAVTRQYYFENWIKSLLGTTKAGSDLVDFMKLCLVIDPAERPDIHELMFHPHLLSFNEDRISLCNCSGTNSKWFPKPYLRSLYLQLDLEQDLAKVQFPKEVVHNLSRKEAEDILIDWHIRNMNLIKDKSLYAGKRGTFLIRKSDSEPGSCVLSLLLWNSNVLINLNSNANDLSSLTVTHHIIRKSNNGYHFENSTQGYESVHLLIMESPDCAPYFCLYPENDLLNTSSGAANDSAAFTAKLRKMEGVFELLTEHTLMKLCPHLKGISNIERIPREIPLKNSLSKRTEVLEDVRFAEDGVVHMLDLEQMITCINTDIANPSNFDTTMFGEYANKVPRYAREKDVAYQRYRIEIFRALLAEYPYGPNIQERILEQARIDIPPVLRGQIWSAILGVPTDTLAEYNSIVEVVSNKEGPSDRQIELDIPRCHQYNRFLSSPQGHICMRNILRSWVEYNTGRMVYWQGLDSVLAPFLVSFRNQPDKAFAGLIKFTQKYLSKTLRPENAAPLQKQLTIFQQLLSFHEPSLSGHLKQIGFTPNLYAVGWFLTLFAHAMNLDKTFPCWDMLIVYPRSLKYYIAVAIMHQLAPKLLEQDFNGCILMLSSMMSNINMHTCIEQAVRMLHKTPQSLAKWKRTERGEPLPYDLFKEEIVPRITLDDFRVEFASANRKPAKMIDVRSTEEYANGHFEDSIHFPATEQMFGDESKSKSLRASNGITVETLLNLKGMPIIVIGSPTDKVVALSFATHLIENGFQYVMLLHGGFPSQL